MNDRHEITKTATLACAAAALFLGACSKSGEGPAPVAPEATAEVKCLGVNECKGKGQCGGPEGNACAGQNSCKGKGWILLPGEDCSTRGGTVFNG